MAKRTDKTAERVKELFNKSNTATRVQWEKVNQKGFDFANDNQLSDNERMVLEEQGMPTFTINRITPVVEMLNFYATANSPRWQAVAAEGSDTDVSAVFSDIADYIWYISEGNSLYGNCINDSITKSIGYLLVTVDPDADRGMGEVIIEQPEPFDIFVDPKSRDMLFRDAGFVLIRKVLPKNHVMKLFPEFKTKIKKATSDNNTDFSYTAKSIGRDQHDFHYKDILGSETIDPEKAEHGELIELYELYEKDKIKYVNVFYRKQPSEEQLKQIQLEVDTRIMEMQKEMAVQFEEQKQKLGMALQSGEMLEERFNLEMEKAQKGMGEQLEMARQQLMSEMISQVSAVENLVMSEKEFSIIQKNSQDFVESIVEVMDFYDDRIKLTCVVGDKTLYSKHLPGEINEYPLVPFHFKWTGTPFPISAVAPLVGKQRELNKAHQIMVHNASLGSSLRWMHEEGSIDTDLWEKYSSSPGALLPIRPGAAPPTPVQPAPLASAFFQIVQEGKGDMEYLAGIYASMQGDTGKQHDTYRGMLAQDEYGTRRVKQWMKGSIEPALRQMGRLVMQFSKAVYQANKIFRVVQPSGEGEKEVEINIPIYNDYGEAVGKYYDYSTAKFDVRIIAGSTLPVNRWAYLDELKQLMQLGIIDDVAVLAETDIRNKKNIMKRKSLYSQLQGQISQLSEVVKDKDGTIETLQRQLVQAGIKGKVKDAEMEIHKKKVETQAQLSATGNEVKRSEENRQREMDRDFVAGKAAGKMAAGSLQQQMKHEADRAVEKHELELEKQRIKKDVGNSNNR
jgi:hypothetical protein